MLVHNTQSNDAQFMNKFYLSLHAINRLTGGYSLNQTEKLKDFTKLFILGLIPFPQNYNQIK